jgi:hypothetical protein
MSPKEVKPFIGVCGPQLELGLDHTVEIGSRIGEMTCSKGGKGAMLG